MFVGIVLIILGAAGGLGELLIARHQRRYRLGVAALTLAFGIANLVGQEHGSAQLLGWVERNGTVTNWQASEATLEVEGPNSRKQADYAVTIKIIPRNHERVRMFHPQLRAGHSFNEPAYMDDATARWLFWSMADPSGQVELRKEYSRGIYSYYYTGRFDETESLVKLHPDAQTYWPSLYPSLRDLEDTYVVVRILAVGVDHPLFTSLKIKLGSPAGAQLLVLLPNVIERVPGAPEGRVLITSPERYIGGLLATGRFLPKSVPP